MQWTRACVCVCAHISGHVGADVLLWTPVCLGKGLLAITQEVVMSGVDQPLCSSQPGLVAESGRMSISPICVVNEMYVLLCVPQPLLLLQRVQKAICSILSNMWQAILACTDWHHDTQIFCFLIIKVDWDDKYMGMKGWAWHQSQFQLMQVFLISMTTIFEFYNDLILPPVYLLCNPFSFQGRVLSASQTRPKYTSQVIRTMTNGFSSFKLMDDKIIYHGFFRVQSMLYGQCCGIFCMNCLSNVHKSWKTLPDYHDCLTVWIRCFQLGC